MYVPPDEPAWVQRVLGDLAPLEGEYLMILAGEASAGTLPSVFEDLEAARARYFGAVFPGLIVGREQRAGGFIVQKFRLTCAPKLIDPARPGAPGFGLALSEPGARRTLCVFVDCLSPHISVMLRELFHHYGNTLQYFGAGAGNSQLQSRPTVFCNGQFESDRAIVALVDQPARVAAGHGWTRAEGPFVATRTDRNVIQELNWEPALRVYERLLHGASTPLSPENFFGVASRRPFGIDKEDAEDVVRDPVGMTAEGGLVCISEVPEHSVLHVLTGDTDQLIAAASRVVADCGAALAVPPLSCLVSDCFSRTLSLGDAFSEELDAVATALERLRPGLPVEGVLALGEIASDGLRMPDFLNKTFVVSLWTEP